MRILFIADGITPFTIGGMQRHSQNLVKNLLKLPEVSVALAFTVNHQEEIPLDSDVLKQLEVTSDNKDAFSFKVFKFEKSDGFPGHYLRSSKKMSAKIFNHFTEELKEFDVVYCKGFIGYSFAKQRSQGKISNIVISNLHGYEMFQTAPNFKIKLQHLLILRKTTKNILVNSDFAVSYGAKITTLLKGIGINNILELPSGVDDSWIVSHVKDLKEKINYVYLGRYERRKGIEEIGTVLDGMEDSFGDNNHFHFIGPIPKEKQIRRNFITYHGSIRDVEEIKSLLDEMDVLVCPSYSEGMPNVILEAMARGLAIIATDVGAVSLMVDSDNGVLLNEPAEEVIKNAMTSFEREDLIVLKQNSLDKVKQFAWSKIATLTVEKLKGIKDGGY